MKAPAILSFDVESNGLHGEGFAIGAIVLDESGTEIARFEGRAPIVGTVDSWVAANVLPTLVGMPENYGDGRALRDAFWTWLTSWRGAGAGLVVLADFGVPVEGRLLLSCVDDAPTERAWCLPYPLHELGTLLLAAGVDPDISREDYVAELIGDCPARKHNPAWDAQVAALCARKAFAALSA